MIYTPEEYAKTFTFGGVFLSARSIKRRCRIGQLPKGHLARKIGGKTGGWIIEVEMFSENIRKQYNIQLTLKKHEHET